MATESVVSQPTENERHKFIQSLKMLVSSSPTRMIFHLIPEKGQREWSPMDELIRDFSSQHHIPLVASYDSFAMADYYEMDGHWLPSGHQKAAEYLLSTVSMDGDRPSQR